MTEIYPVIHGVSSIVLATEPSVDSAVWYVSIFFFIIGSIIVTALLYFNSKKPSEWKHESNIDGGYESGRLRDLAESIRFNPIDEDSQTYLKKHMQSIFFEKFRSIRGVSPEELMDLNTKDRTRLHQIIGDEEIADWILGIKKKKEGFLVKREKIGKKEKYLMDINSILDKMEAWGE